MTVTQWADEKRQLNALSSNEPGRWRTARTPYLAGIMDAFTDPDVVEIVFVKPTQVGGTECILNIIGYIVDQDEGPTMVIYPTDTLAESISKNRLQPMLEMCPDLKVKYLNGESKLLELQFSGMYLSLTGANSPVQLSSKGIRFLLLDEVDKYPPRAGREGDPVALARERTKTYSYNKKTFTTSTPTHASGPVWQEFESCETQLRYYVPCPHCGQFQTLRWRQVKYDNSLEKDSDKADSAHYLCEYCENVITDADKIDMLARGQWRADKSGSRKKLGFHLNAIYSPWVTFSDMVAEWLKSNKEPEILMNFVNSWLAEPFQQVGSTADSQKALANQSRYTQGIVPKEALMITGGVDKQRDCYYYTIRAWGENRRSWNIDHGQVDTEQELVAIFDRVMYDEDGGDRYVNFVLVDSGDDTDTVYDFCAMNRGLFGALKGSSNPIPSRYRLTTIEKADSIAKGMQLVLCDGSYYKDMIFARLYRSDENGWYVFDGCDEEYARQITAEHKIASRVNGRQIMVWKPKVSGAANHYLDCEVYAACAADVMGAFDLLAPPPEQQQELPAPSENDQESDWLGGESWL